MTISMGILGKESIVMAADSRITWSDGTRVTHKTDDGEKLAEVDFSGTSVLIVMAGAYNNFQDVLSWIEDLAKTSEVSNYRSIPEAIERALAEVQRRTRRPYPKKPRAGWQEVYLKEDFDLMVGYFFDERPYFWIGTFATGKLTRRNKTINHVGSPMVLMDYLLKGAEREVSTMEAAALAAYAIEEAKDNDPSCGEAVVMGVLYPNTAWVLAQDEILPFVKAARAFMRSNRKDWQNTLRAHLSNYRGPDLNRRGKGDIRFVRKGS